MKFALVRKDKSHNIRCEVIEHHPPYIMRDDVGPVGEIFIDLSKTTLVDWGFAERRGGLQNRRFGEWLLFKDEAITVVHPHSMHSADDIAKFLNNIPHSTSNRSH